MSLRRTARLTVAATLAACLLVPPPGLAAAATLTQQTAGDRVALTRAIARWDAARARSARVDARMQKVSADLDRAAADEERGQTLLQTRVLAIYRSDDAGPLALVMSASSLRDLTMALDLLDRLAGQDAADLRALKVARAKMRGSAETLLTLQGEQARATEALAAEVARARTGLASSEAALKAYQARTAAAVGRTPPRGTPPQGISGSGAWLTGVASMYGRNFTGRGASGEAIGPYSMMVAHKTLPFGTLIEFEYQGKRAVARVADRGPYTKRRDFDLGPGVVRVFDFSGVHPVRYRIIPR